MTGSCFNDFQGEVTNKTKNFAPLNRGQNDNKVNVSFTKRVINYYTQEITINFLVFNTIYTVFHRLVQHPLANILHTHDYIFFF